GKIFRNCIRDTIDRTIKRLPDGSVFVITGDIPAMWLRDSSCQLRPYILFAQAEPKIRQLIIDLLDKQMDLILLDPYANAFNCEPGAHYSEDRTEMKPELWERKYEIDSLCFPMQLSYLFWKNTGNTEAFTEKWVRAAHTILDVFETEQYHETRSDYYFERFHCPHTDTLSREGKGALVKPGTGLIWSGFRPSDDACRYGYLIPSNMLAVVTLKEMAQIADEVLQDAFLAIKARTMAKQVEQAIEELAVVPGKDFYAYEVDGFGEYNIMDDANLPSLLSIPYIGYRDGTDARYRNTREKMLSEENPYFYKGKALEGIGSPHTPAGYVWDIALAMQAITETDRDKKRRLITMITENDAGCGMMHEGICADDPTRYTRPWFSWANAIFCEMILDYCGIRLTQ
ncbi:MAG: glycoside hydrolase family 125 protein, partial [Lachnospiraceae bacterium]|nr:glycoside hydrolase family 125 protein [Lachnospiraceae bacterium]